MSPRACAGNARERVTRACERCRIKKAKCDGDMPCSRCCGDDEVCRFSLRKRHVLRGAVHKQTDQILHDNESYKAAVLELYKRVISGRRLEDSVHDVQVNTNITAILNRVGVLGQDKDAACIVHASRGILKSEAKSLSSLSRPIQPAITPNPNRSGQPPPLTRSASSTPQATSIGRTSTYRSSGSASATATKPKPPASFEPSARLLENNDDTAQSSKYPPLSSPWPPPTCGPPISDYNLIDAPTTSVWVISDPGQGGSERGPPTPMVMGGPHHPYYAVPPWPQDLQGREYPPQWEWPFPFPSS
ncbi:hypothetical protein G647_03064 [Cladophialophora carrionii CBS 160.54]|uniref:Zn(2)-C6 fungal-type domain-containing protein n=1 Tax=Cladophialophora carrionii CBS 160.54 TaxID=1279043 RepID=V9DK20_9EURO|nr:uncharacterized protein G647_03064 [Cladophialophora carrionii CBS 160.54]ETI26287.1 hypothetical protein G647_03064 [Cladophialophora carrionii CBS 160.54]